MKVYTMKSFTAVLTAAAIAALVTAGCYPDPPICRTCEELTGMVIPAVSIGLPTTGAVVTSTTVVAATATVPEYCKVLGEINPVDPNAPKIKFQVNLPADWNKKTVMFGGGGFDGSIPAVGGNVPIGPTDRPTPLQRGYATFGSDSGHQANALGSQDHSFGVNDEAERNFGGDALKKTRDAAIAVIKTRYGMEPAKSYFAGGSTGGREALAVIQRWPADWDGAIAFYPCWNDMGALLQGHRMNRALARVGAYPNQAKRKVIYDAAMAACDGLDGVVDGLISNQAACNATFDPNVVRCAGGEDTGDTCLSDAQITALNVMNTPAQFNFFLASGLQEYPGYNVWGADLGMINAAYPLQAVVTFLALGTVQPANPMPSGTPYISTFLDQFLKYGVARDAAVNTLLIDPENPGAYAARLSELSKQLDTSTDISAFVARGGKLLIAHGKADVLVSTRASEWYYRKLQARFGHDKVRTFVRYYEIPGLGHAYSAAFTPGWDSLTALEDWVEKKTAPANQIIADTAVNAGRTRPLCEYPKWPEYTGSGDVNSASSFTCSE